MCQGAGHNRKADLLLLKLWILCEHHCLPFFTEVFPAKTGSIGKDKFWPEPHILFYRHEAHRRAIIPDRNPYCGIDAFASSLCCLGQDSFLGKKKPFSFFRQKSIARRRMFLYDSIELLSLQIHVRPPKAAKGPLSF